jgi:transketolase
MASTIAPPIPATSSIQQLAIDTVRTLAMDAVQKADSGHPGTPMALAPLAYVLWTRHMKYDASAPDWPDRDRFVLSNGHASMLQYAVLYLTGYGLTLDDLKQFRQWGSKTPGHPEYGDTVGVETTTGPLGQGVANAVGMAVAEAHLAAEFNRPGQTIVDHHTYFIAGDGCLMEGISHEAASFAGHFKLGKLIGFYDDNHITIDGKTELTYTDDAGMRFEAYGWHVQHVADVNDLDAVDAAIVNAKAVTDKPSLIITRTHIGYGSPNKVDSEKAHGEALGAKEIELTKQNLGWPSLEPFFVPPESLDHWRAAGQRGRPARLAWEKAHAAYVAALPELGAEYDRRLTGKRRPGWDKNFPTFTKENGNVATRASSALVLNAFDAQVPELFGGAADLNPSTLTYLKDSTNFEPGGYAGRNVHFGIREHGMGAMLNGMALHGSLLPFGSTFFIFSDYMRPAIRLAAIMRQHVIWVFTHDSIGVGEDGPTHQPIEQLSTMRAIPNATLIRPADANEVAEAWRVAINHEGGPVSLVLTRQKLPLLQGSGPGLAKGAYVLAEAEGGAPQVVIMSSGSEVSLAVEARTALAGRGVRARVVSMPSHEIFAAQPASYRDTVLPPGIPRVAVEAGHPVSWYRWVGDNGTVVGLERFGASSPGPVVYRELGLTSARVVDAALTLLGVS